MVEALVQKEIVELDELDSGSEDLDDEKLEAMQGSIASGAIQMKLQGKANIHRANTLRVPKFEDADHQSAFNQELAYLQEQIHETGYNAQSETLQEASPEQIKQWNSERDLLLSKDAQLDHASQKISLSYKGLIVDQKLNNLRQKMLENDHNLLIGEYYDKLQSLVNSPLFDCLKMMPKPAVHHAHLTACADLEYLVKLTYKDCVYYSQKANEFHVSAKGC